MRHLLHGACLLFSKVLKESKKFCLTFEISEIVTGIIMGKAVQIVKIDDESETHKFFLDEEALNEILNKDNIRDKPICIISVAGNTHVSRMYKVAVQKCGIDSWHRK